jgi:predicted MFS family arabinose efflux permease
VPLRLFGSRNVAGANLVQALLVVGMFGMFFLGALYMQQILGYDAFQVGLAYLPMTVVMGTMSFRFTGQLNLRFGPQATLLPATAFIFAGLLLLARTPVNATYAVDLLPAMILIGLGAGLGFPSLMTLAMSGATPSDSGLASGLVNTSVQVGGAIGLAVLATLATDRTEAQLTDGASAAPEPAVEPVAPEPFAEAPAAAVERPRIRVRPLPASAAAPGSGCVETGMRVVIGCGGCAGEAPLTNDAIEGRARAA